MNTRFFDLPTPRLFGHRGSAAFPENTMPAFQDAVDAGLCYLELDVWCSKDGIVMVHHDQSMQRMCGKDVLITELTAAQIESLDAGYSYSQDQGQSHPCRGKGIYVPALEEVLSSFPTTFITIEIKQNDRNTAERVLNVIDKTKSIERVIVASAIDQVNQIVRRLNPGIPTNLAFNEVDEFFSWLKGGAKGDYRPSGSALQIPIEYEGSPLVTPESVEAAHALGLEMHIWTINDLEVMMDLLKVGVDGLMSDYPAILLAAAKRAAQ